MSTGLDHKEVVLSLFSNNEKQSKHATGRVSTRSLDEIAQAICNAAWSPTLFHNNIRSNETVESTSLLVLDIDDGCTLGEATMEFVNYKHIIATTRSHQKEKNGKTCDRFRVILFLPRPVFSDREFKEYWYAAQKKWPFVDKACKDAARFFFPCVTVVSTEEGEPFTERVTTGTQVNKPASQPVNQSTGERGDLSKSTYKFLAKGGKPGERHDLMIKAVFDFKAQGYSFEEMFEQVSEVGIRLGFWDAKAEAAVTNCYKHDPKQTYRDVKDWIDLHEWPAMNKDKDKPSPQAPENYRMLFKKWNLSFSQNELDEQIYCNDQYWTESERLSLWVRGKGVGMHGTQELMFATIKKLAFENSFHPIKKIVESATWDGQDHLQKLFNTLTIEEHNRIYNADYALYLKKWIVGIAAKLYRPGSQNLVLTLLGAQGIGKSRWLSQLALWPDAFGEGAVDPGNKDHELRHLTHLIWHIPELDYTTGRRETGALKDYLTRDSVSVRPAYARNTRYGRSICSFAASVNAREFLHDPSGNRRFLIIPLEAVDHTHTVNMQQVLAQAKVLFEQGFKYWLDLEEIKRLNEQNEAFELEDKVIEFVRALKEGTKEMTSHELLKEAKVEFPNKADLTRFGMAMSKAGFVKKRRTMEGKRTYFYCVALPNDTGQHGGLANLLPILPNPKPEVGQT